jgi:hypothetical protein
MAYGLGHGLCSRSRSRYFHAFPCLGLAMSRSRSRSFHAFPCPGLAMSRSRSRS